MYVRPSFVAQKLKVEGMKYMGAALLFPPEPPTLENENSSSIMQRNTVKIKLLTVEIKLRVRPLSPPLLASQEQDLNYCGGEGGEAQTACEGNTREP